MLMNFFCLTTKSHVSANGCIVVLQVRCLHGKCHQTGTELCHSYLLCPGTVYTVVHTHTYIYSKKLWNWPEAKYMRTGFVRQESSVPGWTQFCPETQNPWGSSFANKKYKMSNSRRKSGTDKHGQLRAQSHPYVSANLFLTHPHSLLISSMFHF